MIEPQKNREKRDIVRDPVISIGGCTWIQRVSNLTNLGSLQGAIQVYDF